MNAPATLACSHTPLEQLEIFRRAAAMLASTLELEQTLANTIRLFLPALGDFGFFDAIVEGEDGTVGEVRRTAAAHDDPALEALLAGTRWQRQETGEPNLCALSSGVPALHVGIDDGWYRRIATDEGHLALLRALEFTAMLTVPVRSGDKLVGALTLFMARSGRTYTDGDLAFTAELAALAAPVVANATLLARKRQADAALRDSEQRLRVATAACGIGIWDWNLVSNIVTWSDEVHAMFGMAPGQFGGHAEHFRALVHPDDLPELVARSAACRASRTGFSIAFRANRTDGREVWLETWAQCMTDAAGNDRLIGATLDITRRKRTEEDLRFLARASAELAALDEIGATLQRVAQLAVPKFADWCALDLLEPDDTLRRVAVAHVDPDKVRYGHELFERYHPAPGDGSATWRIIATGCAECIPVVTDDMMVMAARDGEHLRVLRALGLRSFIGVPLAVRGRTLGVLTFVSAESARTFGPDEVALAEDIGRRAAIAIDNASLYRTLQAADQRKDEFLAMLAHELRNPLAPIRVAADLLAMGPGKANLSAISGVLARQVGHMTALVDDLLDVSRVTRGSIELDRAPVSFKAVAASAVEQVRPMVDARSHRLHVDLADGAMTVLGDEKRLVQILANLLNNAAKYTPPGGVIDLSAAPDGGYLQVEVRDNGIGMSADLVGRAFELFSQAARASDRAQGGLGLGLALVRRLVELHGGDVRAFSRGEGCGSRFVVRLPLLDAAADSGAGTPCAATRQPDRAGLRVLVVDDNQDAATVLGAWLASAGHVVDVCYDPYEALGKVHAAAYDVCLLDIGLPGMDGHTLARRIRAGHAEGGADARAPVLIAVTGYGQSHDRSAALAAGFRHYLVKPVGAIDLHALLAQAGV